MNRRSLLKMTPTAGVGTAFLASTLSAAAQSSPIAELPRSSFIYRKDGTALFYRDWGAGTPVLFVHSAGLNSGMWTHQMMALTAQGMRCVAFDRRGHGRSSDPGRGYDFDTLADDLAAVIEALTLRNLTLVAHSTDRGEIARYLTRHGSGRVARIALIAPTSPFLLETADNPHGVEGASAPPPFTGQPTAELIPGAELKVYDAAPHGLFVTHLQKVNDDLMAFIHRGLAPPGRAP